MSFPLAVFAWLYPARRHRRCTAVPRGALPPDAWQLGYVSTRLVLKDAFNRLRAPQSSSSTQNTMMGKISLLQRDVMILKEKCADAAKEGEFLEAHNFQQQALGISLAMCGIVSTVATNVAIEAAKVSEQAIELASITSKKMKLELELGQVIAGPYTNFAFECDFTKCAELQAEIRALSALIDGRAIVQQQSRKLNKMNDRASVKAKQFPKQDRVADELYHHAMGGWR